MARDNSPIVKQSRREGYALHPKAHKVMARKTGIPGQHAQGRHGKPSLYATQLREKQKVRRMYGLLEKQFSRLMNEATRMQEGLAGENLLKLLELRLDNAVYRAGFAVSRRGARQLVSHGHFLLNGRRVDIPSIRLKAGDVVEVREKSKQLVIVLEAVSLAERDVPDYVEVDHNKMVATFARVPVLGDVPYAVQMEPNLVVEFYSR